MRIEEMFVCYRIEMELDFGENCDGFVRSLFILGYRWGSRIEEVGCSNILGWYRVVFIMRFGVELVGEWWLVFFWSDK